MAIGNLVAILKVGLAIFMECSSFTDALNLRHIRKQWENIIFSSVMDMIVILQVNE